MHICLHHRWDIKAFPHVPDPQPLISMMGAFTVQPRHGRTLFHWSHANTPQDKTAGVSSHQVARRPPSDVGCINSTTVSWWLIPEFHPAGSYHQPSRQHHDQVSLSPSLLASSLRKGPEHLSSGWWEIMIFIWTSKVDSRREWAICRSDTLYPSHIVPLVRNLENWTLAGLRDPSCQQNHWMGS